MVSDHELGGWHALGPVVVGGCHAFGTWSPTVSDHEHNLVSDHEPGGCHALGGRGGGGGGEGGGGGGVSHGLPSGAIGAGWVSRARACGLPWSPIMSAIGADWGRVGVTRFGACGLSRSPIMSAIGASGAGWVSRARACALPRGLRS